VEDQKLRQLRRILGLPTVDLEPPPSSLRQKLDQQGSFEETGTWVTVSNPPSREEHISLEEPTITDLGVQDLGPNNPSITDLSVPVVVQVYPYECLEVSEAEMEPNPANSSGNSHIPSTTITTRGVPPPNQPSPVRATMVSTAST
jgi:hypothetical protein